MKLFKFFLLAGLLGLFQHDGNAQAPDCTQSLSLTHTGIAASVQANAGSGQGCATWALSFQVTGSITAVTIQIDGSDDNSTFAAIDSSLELDGTTNPLSWTSSTKSARIVVRSYFPWAAVEITGLTGTGTVKTLLLGYKGSSPALPASISVTPSGTQDVNIIKVGGTPVSSPLPVSAAQSGTWTVQPGNTANTTPWLVNSTLIGNTAVLSGQQSVTGSAVALGTNTSKSICVKAALGNTINVYVGPTGITTSTGFELTPGQGACLPVTNTNLVYVIASTTGASVSWLASK